MMNDFYILPLEQNPRQRFVGEHPTPSKHLYRSTKRGLRQRFAQRDSAGPSCQCDSSMGDGLQRHVPNNDLWRKVAIWPAIGANPRTGGAFPHLTALEPRCLALVSSTRPSFSYHNYHILLSLYPPPYIGGGGDGYMYECLFLSLFLYIRREKRARY